jgi:hypothetical protein
MAVNAAFPKLSLIVRRPTQACHESLAQRSRERAEVLQKLGKGETRGEALKILSAWRERRKAFDLHRRLRDAPHGGQFGGSAIAAQSSTASPVKGKGTKVSFGRGCSRVEKRESHRYGSMKRIN